MITPPLTIRAPKERILRLGRLLCHATLWGAATALGSLPCWAQNTANTAAAQTANADTASTANWDQLTEPQKVALAPLVQKWTTLSDAQQRKWLSLARNYANLTPQAQAKLHERMVEWAALSSSDRQNARLNFAATKQLGGDGRSAKWEAYQALSPEEKQKFAKQHLLNKPPGAALSIKPAAPGKLAPVPATRLTPPDPTTSAGRFMLDRNTLLPVDAPIAP